MSELVEHVQDNLCSRKPSATEPSVIRFCGAGYSDGSFDNSQEMHSLLLCPAQWTALLESPISLVRHKSECRSEEGRSDTFKGDDGVSSENSYEDVPKTERCSQVRKLNLDIPDTVQCDQQVGNSNSITSNKTSLLSIRTETITRDEEVNGALEEISEEEIDDEEKQESSDFSALDTKSFKSVADERKSEDSSSGLNLSHVLPLYPHSTGITSEGSCNITGPCDSPLRGRDTPGVSSVPVTPSSDSRLSFSLVPSHMTHTRNISETPSLPPFISSSTSSAYHSRNSSLASQITTDWFDSDSHSTDIDSCIVMHSGDLQRPVSLQDSKFKLPDFSGVSDSTNRQCFSFTDLRSSHQVVDGMFLPAPELEDTLCTAHQNVVREEDNVNNESFDQKHMASAMKSSEWIKKEMRRARSSMVQVKVSSKTRHVVHFNVKAGDMFIWEFATKRKDIGFGLQFEATELATSDQSQENAEAPPPIKKMAAILPTLRINSYAHPTVGSHTATQDGVYEILFDNSYSRFFAKELFYRITTKPAIPNEHYLDQ